MSTLILSEICLGYVMVPYGIQGEVRFKSFTDIGSFKEYKNFKDQTNHPLRLKRVREHTLDVFIVLFEDITTRTAAETLKGKKIFIEKSQLKALKEEEFYHHDLIGLKVYNEEQQFIGIVKNFINYGRNNVFEIETSFVLEPILVPFHKEFVKSIDVKEKKIVLNSSYIQAFITLEEISL